MEKQILTARFEQEASDVALALSVPGVGTQEQRVPLSVFMTSLSEWSKGEELAAAPESGTQRILAAVDSPDKWQVNALASPLRYALCIEGDWRLTVAVRPAAAVMHLKFVSADDDPEDAETFAYQVPPRLIAGVWLKGQLRAGIIALAASAADLPIAPNDTLHPLTPWIWGNVNHEGQVCFGSTTRPSYGQDGVTNIERTFFESAFNSDICRFPRVRDDRDEDEEDEGHYHTLRSYHQAKMTNAEDVLDLPATSAVASPRTLSSMLKYSIHSGW